jgi:hypothetical protein
MLYKKEIIDLDECVINALKLFIKEKIPKINLNVFKKPLVVGSGNAAVVCKILFNDRDVIFADESTYINKLKNVKGIDGVILISASGGKHAPIIAKETKKRKIPTILLTNNPKSIASNYVNKTYVFPKNSEPYTYNTSTYLSMILSKTKENPRKILNFLKKINNKIPKNLNKYDSFFIIIPDKFECIREMFLTKFDELFGPKISGRAFTPEETKHSKTIIPSDKELFISLGYIDKSFGKNKLNMPLPKDFDYATILCIGYFIIGKIQKQNEPYFKENIEAYARESSKIFGEKINPIVE